MKRIILLLLSLSGLTASAQSPLQDSVVTFQDSVAIERSKLLKNNMWVLGAWAGANIVQGSISAGNALGSDQYFHRMNVYWNTVNLAIAGIGMLAAKKQLAGEHNFNRNQREQQALEKLLLLNTGLDMAYMATGLYLKERGARTSSDQATGYGNSLLLQGGFLLVFDLIQYFENRRISKTLDKNSGRWELGNTPNGMGLAYRF
ncbi:MAG: hypothetical protein HYU71_14855 [Bacteroidetes bacterium]|nr:hypothetical protein [Bacteroidota bacterium]